MNPSLLNIMLIAALFGLAATFLIFWRIDRAARWSGLWGVYYICCGFGTAAGYIATSHNPPSLWLYNLLFGAALASFLAGAMSLAGRQTPSSVLAGHGLALGLVLIVADLVTPFGPVTLNLLACTSYYVASAVVLRRLTGLLPRVAMIFSSLHACGTGLDIVLLDYRAIDIALALAVFVNMGNGLGLLLAASIDYNRRADAARNELLIANAQLTGLTVRLEQKSVEYAEARDRAESANRAKSQFLGNMSHELRTPLNAVIGYGELIQMSQDFAPESKLGGYVGNILAAGRQLLAIVDDVLDLSRVDFGSITLDQRPASVAALIDETIRTIRVAAEEKQLTLEIGSAPDLVAQLDARLIRQALLNIVGNAIKFTPAGGRIRIETRVTGFTNFEIRISDTGPGIPAHERDRVFERFWQKADAMTRSHEGVGLGLSIAKRFIELHQGTIHIEDGAEGGACFVVSLPLQGRATVERDLALSPQ